VLSGPWNRRKRAFKATRAGLFVMRFDTVLGLLVIGLLLLLTLFSIWARVD